MADEFVDPESLMLGAPEQTEENDTLGRMVDECGIIKPNNDMEEVEEIAGCQERIINKTDSPKELKDDYYIIYNGLSLHVLGPAATAGLLLAHY